jgi:hypothetical protein
VVYITEFIFQIWRMYTGGIEMILSITTGDFTMEDTGTQVGTGTHIIDHTYSVIETSTEDR